MSEIYLIRHGQASFGSIDYDRLSENGIRQAAVLGNHLADIGLEFDAVCFGRMKRHKQTADGLINAYRDRNIPLPKPSVDPGFDEYDAEAVWKSQVARMQEDDPGVLDEFNKNPKDNTAFQKVFSRVVKRWISGNYDAPDDTTWNAFKTRVSEGVFALIDRHGRSKRIAVFTSAGPVSVAVQAALDLADIKAVELSWQVINASITKFVYGRGTLSLTGFNETAHLVLTGDKNLLTYR